MKNKSLYIRLISIALSLVFVLAIFAVPVYASGTAKIRFSHATSNPGQIVTVPVTIENNSGIATFRFRVFYNAEDLEFISAGQGEVLTSGTLTSTVDSSSNNMTFLWYSTKNISGDGVVAELKFKVSDKALGVYNLQVNYLSEDFLNDEADVISCIITEGSITVEEPTEPTTKPVETTAPAVTTTAPTEPAQTTAPQIPETSTATKPEETTAPNPTITIVLMGDANQDGVVNVKDATTIQKFVAEIVELSPVGRVASDVYSDTNVNVKDATVIQKFVAEIPVSGPVGTTMPWIIA